MVRPLRQTPIPSCSIEGRGERPWFPSNSSIHALVDPVSSGRTEIHTIAFSANARISLIALGARFLKVAPCTFTHPLDVFSLLYSVFRPIPQRIRLSTRYTAAVRGLHQTERTLLCKWIVYSLATTSSMALRPGLPDGVSAVVDVDFGGMTIVNVLATR